MATNVFGYAIPGAGWMSGNRFVAEVSADVRGQVRWRTIAAPPIFLESSEDDCVRIAAELADKGLGFRARDFWLR